MSELDPSFKSLVYRQLFEAYEVAPYTTLSHDIDVLMAPDTSKRDRLGACLRICRTCLPDSVNNVVHEFLLPDFSAAPFSCDFKLGQFIANGVEHDVYLMASELGTRDFVIKVPKHEFTMRGLSSEAYIGKIMEEKRLLDFLFAPIPGFIPSEYYLLAKSPYKFRPDSYVVIQDYLPPNSFVDFFAVDPSYLSTLFAENPEFAYSVDTMCQVFNENPILYDNQVDLFGKNNLVIYFSPMCNGEPHLVLLEPRFVDPHIVAKYPERSEKLKCMISDIRAIRDAS
ncbi:MAG: hypothetical protein R3B92_01760 [Patescibacteria group bacterium]